MALKKNVYFVVILILLCTTLLLKWLYDTNLNFQKTLDSMKGTQQVEIYEQKEKPPVLEHSMKDTQQVVISEQKAKPPILEPLASRELGPPGKASAADELERIWNYVYNRQYNCEKSKYMGGREGDGDGAYNLCVEKQFWPFPDATEAKCLMYSLGVGKDFSFDDEMAKLGCEVHAFDPSMEDYEDGMIRESGVIFHKVGIADKDNDNGFKGWKMRTLKTIIKELGHQNRHLDYLKVDTDKDDGTGFEDTIMQELLDSGLYKCVRQYAMEIHMPGPLAGDWHLQRCRRLYKQMRRLNDGGWRLFNTTDNLVWYRKTVDPNAKQTTRKMKNLQGKGDVILWEINFVNFDLEGVCEPYVK